MQPNHLCDRCGQRLDNHKADFTCPPTKWSGIKEPKYQYNGKEPAAGRKYDKEMAAYWAKSAGKFKARLHAKEKQCPYPPPY